MKKLEFYEIPRIFRKFSLKSSLVSKPSVDCRFLGILEVIFTHFHFFALFAPKSLFRSKITFLHFLSLFRQKATFRSFGAPCLRSLCRLSFLDHFGSHFRPWGDFIKFLAKMSLFSENVTF